MTLENRSIVSWHIDDLKEHPRQCEMFPGHSQERFEMFVADLRANGQRDPVEIGPDGVIFDGHHRVKAAKVLNWDEVDVVVLHDLAAAGEAAQLQHMYSRNTQRRQMTELDFARAFRCMKHAMGNATDGSLRDEIAALLGCPKKGRTLERLEKVLDLPPLIQTAFSHGTLKKTVVYEICRLPDKVQLQIADRIARGEKPATVVADYLMAKRPKTTADDDIPQELYFMLMDFLKGSLDTLVNQRDNIIGTAMDHEHAAVLLSRTADLFVYLESKEIEARQDAIAKMQSLASVTRD